MTTMTQPRAERTALGYVGSTPGDTRGSNSWFTPTKYVEAARRTLGSIELDPFSSDEAQAIVRAERYFTEADDAFTQDWSAATVFMNPPYSGRLVADACNRFMDDYQAQVFGSGIVLVNNATETRWFQRALREARAVCFTDHRIAFWNADGKPMSSNTRGQAFFLFTDTARLRAFRTHFAPFGSVLPR